MSVDYDACKCCGNIVCDCGDNYNICVHCGNVICSDCLVEPWEEDEDGEMAKKCCPFCSGESVADDTLLEFLLNRYNMTKESAVEIYKLEATNNQ